MSVVDPCCPQISPPTIDVAVRSVALKDVEPLSWESLSASATLVATPCGTPIRTIVTGRRFITTGVYASRKAGRPQPYESMNERAFFMHCEVDTEVLDYRAQPFRLEFAQEGRRRTYIVDCVRLMADGSIEVVEVKSDPRALHDHDYAEKLHAIRTICEQVGWRFRLVFKMALLEPAAVHQNVLDVQSWRMTEYTSADVFRIVEAFRRTGRAVLGDLVEHFASRALAFAKLKAMMVGRIVRIDLTQPIGNATPVALVSDSREAWK
ncbi:TnsA endonuclease N-terminal domain-containing protein [Brevundimonas sp. PAMC22021]|uniref:TnsA endonuclease N-terminal domain-containing protein n=1 Tax=Brevundimonas sp. PAMC22021 TaxID=2861285 RepID=UPI001C62AE08|nr:TnsA endonuclease N-terminal domain-containing protein [Brevundimonas sp. PAMC22021]QYF87280.1 TnsA endonuclease N-terminal domain-containing protein [Brevundimonas sp. PAMC22021]